MLHLSKNSIFKLKYSYGNHIHNFASICCAYDYFGSEYPAIRAVTLFTVYSVCVYAWKVILEYL